MTQGNMAIGVDLGGTNLKLALVSADGSIVDRASVPVGNDRSATVIAELIGEQIRSLCKTDKISGVSVGCGIPGIVDAERGIVHASPHFPPWHDEPMAKLIAHASGCEVSIDNDANLHALAEALHGAGRGHRNIVMLTLGTGVGGGIVLDGHVFHGDEGFAGEVGHIVIEPDGPPCGCGSKGCLELYAASQGFALHASRLDVRERDALLSAAKCNLSEITPEKIAVLDDAGDPIARKLWCEFGRYLGVGIASMMSVLGIMNFVIGGGIMRSWKRFQEETRRSVLEHTYPHHATKLQLIPAQLGEESGVMGAALLSMRGQNVTVRNA